MASSRPVLSILSLSCLSKFPGAYAIKLLWQYIATIFQDENKHLKLIKRDAQMHLSEPSFTQAGPLIICCK
jgi:hypothetical protein